MLVQLALSGTRALESLAVYGVPSHFAGDIYARSNVASFLPVGMYGATLARSPMLIKSYEA